MDMLDMKFLSLFYIFVGRYEQEPREGLARTPKGDRVGITSPTDTEFDRKDKDAHPSPRGLAAMYISVRTGPTRPLLVSG